MKTGQDQPWFYSHSYSRDANAAFIWYSQSKETWRISLKWEALEETVRSVHCTSCDAQLARITAHINNVIVLKLKCKAQTTSSHIIWLPGRLSMYLLPVHIGRECDCISYMTRLKAEAHFNCSHINPFTLKLETTFSQHFKDKMYKWSGKNWQCNHFSSEKAMREKPSSPYNCVMYYFCWTFKGHLTLVTLRSERVERCDCTELWLPWVPLT